MAKAKTGQRQVSNWLPDDLMAGLELLAARNGRPMAAEMAHAIERHLASPPTVEVIVSTPPLVSATVSPPEAPPTKKRGRPRKQAPPQ